MSAVGNFLRLFNCGRSRNPHLRPPLNRLKYPCANNRAGNSIALSSVVGGAWVHSLNGPFMNLKSVHPTEQLTGEKAYAI
jgi:hypothetical protein